MTKAGSVTRPPPTPRARPGTMSRDARGWLDLDGSRPPGAPCQSIGLFCRHGEYHDRAAEINAAAPAGNACDEPVPACCFSSSPLPRIVHSPVHVCGAHSRNCISAGRAAGQPVQRGLGDRVLLPGSDIQYASMAMLDSRLFALQAMQPLRITVFDTVHNERVAGIELRNSSGTSCGFYVEACSFYNPTMAVDEENRLLYILAFCMDEELPVARIDADTYQMMDVTLVQQDLYPLFWGCSITIMGGNILFVKKDTVVAVGLENWPAQLAKATTIALPGVTPSSSIAVDRQHSMAFVAIGALGVAVLDLRQMAVVANISRAPWSGYRNIDIVVYHAVFDKVYLLTDEAYAVGSLSLHRSSAAGTIVGMSWDQPRTTLPTNGTRHPSYGWLVISQDKTALNVFRLLGADHLQVPVVSALSIALDVEQGGLVSHILLSRYQLVDPMLSDTFTWFFAMVPSENASQVYLGVGLSCAAIVAVSNDQRSLEMSYPFAASTATMFAPMFVGSVGATNAVFLLYYMGLEDLLVASVDSRSGALIDSVPLRSSAGFPSVGFVDVVFIEPVQAIVVAFQSGTLAKVAYTNTGGLQMHAAAPSIGRAVSLVALLPDAADGGRIVSFDGNTSCSVAVSSSASAVCSDLSAFGIVGPLEPLTVTVNSSTMMIFGPSEAYVLTLAAGSGGPDHFSRVPLQLNTRPMSAGPDTAHNLVLVSSMIFDLNWIDPSVAGAGALVGVQAAGPVGRPGPVFQPVTGGQFLAMDSDEALGLFLVGLSGNVQETTSFPLGMAFSSVDVFAVLSNEDVAILSGGAGRDPFGYRLERLVVAIIQGNGMVCAGSTKNLIFWAESML